MAQVRLATWTAPRVEAGPPRVALGAMNFGKRTDEAESRRIVARALERGVELFDTANVYGDGVSEQLLGRALGARAASVLVATKVGLMAPGGRREGLGRERMLAAAEESRARLGVAAIDLYYLHAPDPSVPLAETVDAIASLLGAGTIRAWGVSNYASWQIQDLQGLAAARGIAGPAVSQVLYNALIRQIEIEHLRFAGARGLHVTVYNALAAGLLAGRYRPGDAIAKGSRFDGNKMYQRRYWSARMLAFAQDVCALSADAGRTPASLAYGWLAARPGVGSILIGPATLEQLDEALDACARPLDAEVTARVDALYRDFQGTDATYAR